MKYKAKDFFLAPEILEFLFSSVFQIALLVFNTISLNLIFDVVIIL